MNGRYKIWYKSGIFSYWKFFVYRQNNGILETKEENKRFAKWTVINNIPAGAELV